MTTRDVVVNGARISYALPGSGAPLVLQAPGWGIGRGLYAESLAPPSVAALQATMATDGDFPVLNGRHDHFCPLAQAELLRQGIPDAGLVAFEASGHFPWVEEPEAFFAAVRAFLRD